MSIQETFEHAYRLHQSGNLSAAENLYRDILGQQPLHGNALRFLGLALCQSDRSEEGVETLIKASAIKETRVDALNDLAVVYIQQGKFKGAEESLAQALADQPDHADVLSNLAGVYILVGKSAAAVETYQQAIDAAPKDFSLRHRYAKALDEVGRSDDAIAQCDLILKHHPSAAVVLATKGACYTSAGRYQDAIDALEKAVEQDRNLILAQSNLGFCYLQAGHIESARDALHAAVTQDPNHARTVALYAHALCLCGQAQTALDRCLGFLSRHQGHAEILSVLPQVYQTLGRPDDVARLLDLNHIIRPIVLPVPNGFTDLATFNRDLAALVRQDPSLLQSPTSKSTAGGFQTGGLSRDAGPPYALLLDTLEMVVNRYMREIEDAGLSSHPAFINRPETWSIHAWGVVLKDGGHQKSHIHPSAWISGVYHVELPSSGMNEETGNDGWLEFGRPILGGIADTEKGHTRTVRPAAGTAVLFPSFIPHMTIPFSSGEDRISVAFDIVRRH